MGWAHGQSHEMLRMLQSPGRLCWSSLLQGCPALANGSTPPSHQPRAASPGARAQHSFPPRARGVGGGGREDSQGFQLFPVPHVGLLVPWCPVRDTKGEVRHLGEIVLVPQQAISGRPARQSREMRTVGQEQSPKRRETTAPCLWG